MQRRFADVTPAPSESSIICPTTAWYLRRMGLMFLMLAAFAGWFYKDYKFGYPEKARIYSEYGRVKAQPDGQKEWTKLAGEKGWANAPEPMPDTKIQEQGKFALVLGLAALAVLIRFLLQRGTTLQADHTSFTTPIGQRIPFDKVFRIDKRKWKHKGLATVFYRDEQGAEKKTNIDDLKYSGADQVLDRLLGRFSGEVVDLDEPATKPDAPGESGPTTAA